MDSRMMVQGQRAAALGFRFPYGVEGYLTEDEGRFLYRLASGVREGGLIVELGAYKGRSTICLAQAGRAVRSVDHFKGEQFDWVAPGDGVWADHMSGDYWDAFMANVKAAGVGKWVYPTRRDTVEAAAHVDGPVDLLFIDSAHEYEHVAAEWAAWSPKMAADGVVVFDDWNFPGVARVIKEFVEPAGWDWFEIVGKDMAFKR